MGLRSDMKMFYWASKALANYGDGHIIVLAVNIEQAREKALAELNVYARTHLMLVDSNGDFITDDDEEEYRNLIKAFIRDLGQEPETKECIFIKGSK